MSDEQISHARTLVTPRQAGRTDVQATQAPAPHWPGYRQAPEQLIDFCLPDRPVVAQLLRLAGELLQRNGHDATLLDASQADAARIGLQVAAVWNVLSGLRIAALVGPASLADGQRLLGPARIVQGRSATALDMALLMAAVLERMGLRPLLLLEQTHAMLGVWLRPPAWSQPCSEDLLGLRKRADLKELLVCDSGLLLHNGTFKAAMQSARQRLQDDSQFVLALDVCGCREVRAQRRIEVLENAGELQVPDVSVAEPVLSAEDSTPAGRLARWQRKLLDLSLRNPLLNLRDTRSSISLLVPEPALLEDQLAAGESFVVEPLPQLQSTAGAEPAALAGAQAQQASEAIRRGRLLSPLERERIDSALIELYRRSRSDLEEGGANTLYLAVGVLYWRRPGQDDKVWRAPLVLLPVTMSRKSINAPIQLALGDDEPRFNTTLLEMLRQDFALDIRGLDGLLPGDERGVDIPGILTRIRREVLDLAGFEVRDEVLLTTFSFSKYLMWKDLVDRIDQLRQNPVVRHLLDSPRAPFGEPGEFIEPAALDAQVGPDKLFTPLSADSSQLAAVVASAAGRNFVMIGPPGTGKSQTIANMIAHNLALGRRVLFVAEKAAALDVVYRRLCEHGLGGFCLELHSNKSRKQDVLRQLGDAWRVRSVKTDELWEQETRRLRLLRDDLNQVVRALHQRHVNGLSVRQAMAIVVASAAVPKVALRWAGTSAVDAAALERLFELAERIDTAIAELGDMHSHPLAFIRHGEWSMAWQEDLLLAAERLATATTRLREAQRALRAPLGLGSLPESGQWHEHWTALLELLPQLAGRRMEFAFTADLQERLDAAQRASVLVRQHNELQDSLAAGWNRQRLPGLDLNLLEQRWRRVEQSWWPLNLIRDHELTSWLEEQDLINGQVDVPEQLPKLRQLQQLRQDMQALRMRLEGFPGWDGAASDLQQLGEHAALGQQLRSSIARLAADPLTRGQLRDSLRELVCAGNEQLQPGGSLHALIREGLDGAQEWRAALASLAALAGCSEAQLQAPGIEALQALAGRLAAVRAQLRSWCAWQRLCSEAAAQGLQPLLDAIAAGQVAPGQVRRVLEVNHARGWLAQQVDACPELRQFVPAEHERKIQRFREADDRVRDITTEYIRTRLRDGLVRFDDPTHHGEFAVLRRELEKKARHKPLRQLLTEAGNAIASLTPCLLMSPLSIAQYLPENHPPFDLVIFDEASQISVWDAIGAIARGRQVVMVGDPKQLPPTSFFTSAQASEDEEVDEDEDLESILDELLGANLPTRTLSWHYRSRHESLITFSNHRYYRGGLITFPSPSTTDRAVSLEYVGGTYDRGGSQTNRAEADAIVAEIVEHLQDLEPRALSIGVVTFNQKQQSLILDLLDAARRANPGLDRHFDESLVEPVFVKNLESVQGDERDLILFSTTFGPDSIGQVSMNFGPLNRAGGERRLNVAITRARRELKVFTSLRPEQIDLARTRAEGVRDLRHFLEFALHGPVALDAAVFGSVGDFDSPFEESVAAALARRGWTVHPQVGVSRFRIDLGVVDPDMPGRYLAGIECDGATYHRSATARDRDRIRESVLRGLGWEILRLWSTDYWIDGEAALDKLDQQLRALLQRQRQRDGLLGEDAVASLLGSEGGELPELDGL